MLVLSRKLNEKIVIDGHIEITVVKIDRNTVRLGITAPEDVKVYRSEILEQERALKGEHAVGLEPRLKADATTIGV